VEPQFERPYVGPLQLGGLGLAVLVIIVGLALYYTSRGARPQSSMSFIVNGNGNGVESTEKTNRKDAKF
jgi:hypothetical protein